MTTTTEVNLPAQDGNGPQVAGNVNFFEKYGQERSKRVNAGPRSYIDINESEKFKKFAEDPWIDAGTPVNRPVPEGGHCRALITGAGFGGILFAIKLIKQGFSADDIVIVDPAGGFGGTWYWNRYPGLMCDTESYIYMPLLEDLEYMPSMKYASGYELRAYAEKMATKYGLHKRAMFQTSAKNLTWNADKGQWDVQLTLKPKGGEESSTSIHADYVVINAGVLNNPHLPEVPGIEDFQGHTFHSARWDYEYTGGSIEDPKLAGLEGKRVAFVGTGATAIQAVPHLGKYSKELLVFQRTPSAVDRRDNRATTEEEWKSAIASKAGWQKERNLNFNSFICNEQPAPEVNLVNDQWTRSPSYSAMIGGPKDVSMETVGKHIEELNALDYPRQEAVRQRARAIVTDAATAEKLQAWYQTWCKRPCFHDEYLPTFNRDNVKLVDTQGRGLEKITRDAVVVNGETYPVDAIIWGTGFRSPGLGSPADKCGMKVTGVDGLAMESKHADGLTTLHGVVSRGFPNMFWPGPFQAGASANQMHLLDVLSTHVASIIGQANKGVSAQGKHAVIQPSKEGEEAWAMRILSGAIAFAAIAGCTPSYLNMEGGVDLIKDPADQMKFARMGIWSKGINDYTRTIEAWRANGDLEGLEVGEA